MTEPSISVLMPVHNCVRHVAAALRSVLRQTLRDFECLLIDDGSTDDTAAICAAVAGDDPRVRLVRKPNTGLVDTLNWGLMQARAPIVARMDGDDISYPHRFETQRALLDLGRCVAVSSGFVVIDERGKEVELRIPADATGADPDRVPPREPYLPHPFMMFVRDEVLALGGYEFCVHSEDAELCWRLFDRGAIWNIPEALGKYRLHADSISSSSSANARIQAVSAQLAAISQRRRRAGQQPICFDLSPAELAARADSLVELVELQSEALTPEEHDRLALGSGLRFLDYARFRKYEVEPSDVAFAADALSRADGLLNEKELDWARRLFRAAAEKVAPVDRDSIEYRGIRLACEPGLIEGRVRTAIDEEWYELEESRNLPNIIEAGERVLELGTGLGFITTLLAKDERVEWVETFEANPRLARLARRTAELNGVADKVTVHNAVALPAPQVESCDFYLREEFWASSMQAEPWEYQEKIAVPTVDLNALIAARRPTLLVIDIEGGELDLIAALDVGDVRKVFLELHQEVIGRQGMLKVFSALAERNFHYDQWHSEKTVVLFSRADR
jgi:FkbM family methyltransferase